MCTHSKQQLQNILPSTAPCINDIEVHISFDYAQQIHFPNDPMQPGPIYFLTPRKCGLFGICADGVLQQINYLIDESVDCGKGSNTVCSYLHDYLCNYSYGEKVLHCHADNCSGQNKNSTMMQVVNLL
jgi:hypothetical protein